MKAKSGENPPIKDMYQYENEAYNQDYRLIAGIDEVGRGCLAGPVAAAAVILPSDFIVPGIDDSKKLTEKKRRELAAIIKQKAVSWAVSFVYPPLVDELNIYRATQLAMQAAVLALNHKPDMLLIDAMKLKEVNLPQNSIIKGDSLSISIACASIIAKVERDNMMVNYDDLFPGYDFASHKGYGTKKHLAAIFANGPCLIHRKSFEPIKTIIDRGELGATEQANLF